MVMSIALQPYDDIRPSRMGFEGPIFNLGPLGYA